MSPLKTCYLEISREGRKPYVAEMRHRGDPTALYPFISIVIVDIPAGMMKDVSSFAESIAARIDFNWSDSSGLSGVNVNDTPPLEPMTSLSIRITVSSKDVISGCLPSTYR